MGDLNHLYVPLMPLNYTIYECAWSGVDRNT